MTYDARELSKYEGEPLELYEFQYGSLIYRYTSSNTDVVIAPHTYLAVPIRRGKIERGQDIDRVALPINISRKATLTDLFILSPPTNEILVTIKRIHDGDSELITLWSGRVVNVKFSEDTADMRCESIHTSIKRPALRRLYQLNCPHVLYKQDCGVNEVNRRVNLVVESVANLVIYSSVFAGYPAGYFSGGFLSFQLVNMSAPEFRFINYHTGNYVVISIPSRDIVQGTPLLVRPGCDRTLNTCVNKFGNELNYGGYPYIPQKNPFGSTPIF